MMRSHLILAQSFAKMMGHSFRQAASVNEHKGRPMRGNKISQPPINFSPNFVRHHRF